jgi:hypothetical protein
MAGPAEDASTIAPADGAPTQTSFLHRLLAALGLAR